MEEDHRRNYHLDSRNETSADDLDSSWYGYPRRGSGAGFPGIGEEARCDWSGREEGLVDGNYEGNTSSWYSRETRHARNNTVSILASTKHHTARSTKPLHSQLHNRELAMTARDLPRTPRTRTPREDPRQHAHGTPRIPVAPRAMIPAWVHDADICCRPVHGESHTGASSMGVRPVTVRTYHTSPGGEQQRYDGVVAGDSGFLQQRLAAWVRAFVDVGDVRQTHAEQGCVSGVNNGTELRDAWDPPGVQEERAQLERELAGRGVHVAQAVTEGDRERGAVVDV